MYSPSVSLAQARRGIGIVITLIGRVWESLGCSAWPQTTQTTIV